jgi:hypothetical protein
MVHKTDSFNIGFGINFTRSKENCVLNQKRRRFAISRKASLSIPGFGVFLAIVILGDRTMKNKVGTKMLALRGILYGSIVGIPLGVALDIAGMVTQVKAWVDARKIKRGIDVT